MIGRLLHRVAPEHRALFWSFMRFGIVGASGVPVDAATVYACRDSLGLYGAGAVAYFVAATWTFAFNRLWTFKDRAHGALWRQWLAFLGANLSGMVLNRGCFFLLVTVSATCRAYPVLAVAAGAIAGMSANFVASRRLVFREKA
jgi:putative flippase GtrA